MSSSGSATAWTRWVRSGPLAAGTTPTVTTAAAPMGGSSAPTTAARPPACGAPGPAGRRAAFPVGGAREPDTGEEPNPLYIRAFLLRLKPYIKTEFFPSRCGCAGL